MLKISDEFLKGEYREGFYVESLMKKNWAVQLDLLSVISEICARHSIRWFADSGTLLGAVRHHGFIPWDDDVDIVMFREDFDRFFEVARVELPPEYYVGVCGVDASAGQGCINNKSCVGVSDKKMLERFYGFPYLGVVDVFPFDYISDDNDVFELQCNMIVYLFGMIRKMENSIELYEEDKTKIVELAKLFGMEVNKDNVFFEAYRLMDLISRAGGVKKSDQVGWMAWIASHKKDILQTAWYDETIDLQFENILIKAPKEYEKVLEVYYGKEWKTPIKGTAGHNYPGYKQFRYIWEAEQGKQVIQQVLRQICGKEVPDSIRYKMISASIEYTLFGFIFEQEKYAVAVPVDAIAKSDLYVRDESKCMEEYNGICANMTTVLYAAGCGGYVCGLMDWCENEL